MTRGCRWILAAAAGCVILVVVVFAVPALIRAVQVALRVELTDFFVYESPVSVSGTSGVPVEIVSSHADALFACGYLRASGPASLGFLLVHDEKPLGWFVLEKLYEPGYLCERLPSSWRQPGSYRVEVWLPRHKIGSAEFVVVEP
jgi:hypothetical protein